MDFEISEELKMIQSMVREFVSEQLKPLERTVLGRAADLSDAQMYLPADKEQELIGMAREMGLWGVGVPEELGGAGLGTLGNCLIEEELSQTVVPFTLGDVPPMLFECDSEQQDKYLRPALDRERFPLVALMEPDGESAPNRLKMRAVKKDGCYELTGDKVTFSRTGDDYFAIVFAVTQENAELCDGVSCFLVDKEVPGFQLRGDTEKTGWQARVRQPLSLTFAQCKVEADKRIGEEGKAFQLGERWLPGRRIVRGARAVGAAVRLLDECTVQAQTWISFGQAISGRPSIQAALGDIATRIHTTRLLVHEAAWKADQGQAVQREAAMVKLFATEMMHFAADNAAHIFNAPAYVGGLPMERFCRNAIAEGSAEQSLQLQRSIVAKDVLRGLRV